MTKKITSIGCGDWHRGWGLGGHDHLGKLMKGEQPNSYVWKGYCQGRHNNKLTSKYTVTFDFINDHIVNEIGKYSLPDTRDILEAIRILNS